MIESKLSELLERAGERTAVGPPPLDALRAGAARRRRRRTAAWSAVSAVTVAAVIGGTTLLMHGSTAGKPQPPVASTPPAPVAMRMVGFGHATIAVPTTWGTNQSSCGTPYKDTVQIDDPSRALLCMSYRPQGVESVELGLGEPRLGFHADETLQIDGVPVQRQRTRCERGSNGVTTCRSTVRIPSLNVWFRAESSTDAGEVDKVLDRIAVVPDQVGIPSYQSLRSVYGPSGTVYGPSGTEYAKLLRQVGLKPAFQTRKSPGYPLGIILGVAPTPGTILAPGAKVTITVVGP